MMRWSRFLLLILMGVTGRVCFWCHRDEIWHICGWASCGSGHSTVTTCGTTGMGRVSTALPEDSPCRDAQDFQKQFLKSLLLCLSFSRQVSLPVDRQQGCYCHCRKDCSAFAFVCLHLQICYKAKTITEKMGKIFGRSPHLRRAFPFLWRVYVFRGPWHICACPNW